MTQFGQEARPTQAKLVGDRESYLRSALLEVPITTTSKPASPYLERLIRHAAGAPEVAAAFVGGPLAEDRPDPYAELGLYLVAPDPFVANLMGWLAPLGDVAFLGPTEAGCRLVTVDGLAVEITVAPWVQQVPGERLRTLFNRTGQNPAGTKPSEPPGNLGQEAARFWDRLYRVGAALGRGWSLTTHGELEECREQLLNLYRLALTPGRPEQGWAGADTLPGARALEPLKEWLVVPLDLRAQLRCAHKLGAAYESLMLPLVERLGLTYPWAMRNLAFQRLAGVQPDRTDDKPREPELPEPEPPKPPGGPIKVKVKIKRPQ